MKLAMCLTLVPLAAEAALPSNGWFGGRGLALVVKGGDQKFTYATKDGGSDSASFYGEAPKGGSFLREIADSFRNIVKDTEEKCKKETVVAPTKEDHFHVGPFWESKLFKEGGLGFLFGLGTGVCVRKVNHNAAYAVSGALVAAQYVSRTDILGFGGKLGWPKLDDYKLRDCERENFDFIWRTGRTFKHTVQESLETCEGYVIGLAAGLKAPLP
ncbi:unnamed protein product [Ectocarpus sp. CCAP 1310/34]|nr:unnamed protein product [Ectocarpus sp. CCAP 1310/34]